MRQIAVTILLWLYLTPIAVLAADGRTLAVQETPAKRVALVIGNAKYAQSPLKNPVNDARDVARSLRGLGFDVIEKTDVSQKEMNRAITQFGEKLSSDAIALFFYAGHGMQVKGKNYLIPIDAQIASETSVRSEAVDVDALLEQLSTSSLNVVILDACRNNPFERRFRNIGGGLAQMDAPKGTLIAYATSPGKVASDGEGRNGLYTQELLRLIQTPGLPVEAVFKRVRANVAKATGDNQIPWEASSLTGDFFFRSTSSATVTPATLGANSSVSTAGNGLALEIAFWDSVKDSRSETELRAYLDKFPSGQFSQLALVRLQSLEPKPTDLVSTSPGKMPERQNASPAMAVALPGKLIVYRESAFAGSNVQVSISSDGVKKGILMSGSYLAIEAQPGARQATAHVEVNRGSCSQSFNVESGRSYYFKVDVLWGSGCEMIPVQEAGGRQEISRLERKIESSEHQ